MSSASYAIDPTALEALPSPPSVLLELLEACVDDDVEFATLARICARDAALTARILALANSAAFRRRVAACTSLERVLVSLGLDTVKTLALTSALLQTLTPKQSLPAAPFAAFWRHALVTAELARALARTLSVAEAEQLYLAGLLHDIGRLVIASQLGEWPPEGVPGTTEATRLPAFEHDRIGVDHCTVGAALLRAWRLPEPLAMVARHHHAGLAALEDAPLALRLVHLANALDSPYWSPAETDMLADALFGLTPGVVRRLHRETQQQVEPLCAALGFDAALAPATPLAGVLRDRVLVDRLDGQLARAEDEQVLLATIAECVTLLFGVDRVRFLLPTGAGRLRGHAPCGDDPACAAIDCAAAGLHLPGRAAAGEPCSGLLSDEALGVLEHQLAADAEALYCLPLCAAGACMAVLVLAVSAPQLGRLRAREGVLRGFGEVCGRALARLRARLDRSHHAERQRAQLEQARLRQLVHEAGNPLSIAQNYLELLAERLVDDTEANADLVVLREELDRVGAILVRLVDAEAAETETESDVAMTLRRLAGVLDHALCRPRGIDFSYTGPQSLPPLTLEGDALRQVLVNLVRNAAESLDEGGRITVVLEDGVQARGRPHVELRVEDDGPGIPAARLASLFESQQSTKPGHAGVGLSVVRNLVETAGGVVSCRSRVNAGCRFQLLLPLARR